jgi:hypothetical protein
MLLRAIFLVGIKFHNSVRGPRLLQATVTQAICKTEVVQVILNILNDDIIDFFELPI